MTRAIEVPVPGATYEVVIGEELLASAGSRLRELAATARKVALVTDSNVAERWALAVDTSLARAEFGVTAMTVPAGETSKSWEMAGQLVEAIAVAGLGREDVVVAVGGGVVGDLAGFAAAVYQRGIAFVQVPTTLLAMVDSSVGGKTAVDLSAGKNLAGAFKQPLVVLADVGTLATLSDAEWLSGVAEAVKSALLDGEEFTSWLEEHAALIGERDTDVVTELIARCVAFKAGVVARDEKEEGPRECLNYGHTLGHAIEKVAGYGTFTHGAAIAEGMRFAARVSLALGFADAEFVRRQDRLLDDVGLCVLELEPSVAELLAAMHGDKKARGGAVRMVLPSTPGVWQCVAVDDATLKAHLAAWAATKGEGRP